MKKAYLYLSYFFCLDFEMLKAEIELLKTQLKQGEETNKTLGKLSN